MRFLCVLLLALTVAVAFADAKQFKGKMKGKLMPRVPGKQAQKAPHELPGPNLKGAKRVIGKLAQKSRKDPQFLQKLAKKVPGMKGRILSKLGKALGNKKAPQLKKIMNRGPKIVNKIIKQGPNAFGAPKPKVVKKIIQHKPNLFKTPERPQPRKPTKDVPEWCDAERECGEMGYTFHPKAVPPKCDCSQKENKKNNNKNKNRKNRN